MFYTPLGPTPFVPLRAPKGGGDKTSTNHNDSLITAILLILYICNS